MAENNNFINVGGRLHSIATGNVLAGTDEIYDDGKGKKQSTINAETDAILAQHTSVIQGLNSQNYETYAATNQTTAVTDVFPATGSVNTIYRLGNWDGSQFDPSCYTEYSWNGTQYVPISTKTQIDEVFDISAYHASGGILTTYADLSAALDSNNSGGVPQSLQRGGMSIKFVCSSDNKYVQYRLMSNTFSTTKSDWQGVDNEPTAGSDNLIKSGGVYKVTGSPFIETVDVGDGNTGYFITISGVINSNSMFTYSTPILIEKDCIVHVRCNIGPSAAAIALTDAQGSSYSVILTGKDSTKYLSYSCFVQAGNYVAFSWRINEGIEVETISSAYTSSLRDLTNNIEENKDTIKKFVEQQKLNVIVSKFTMDDNSVTLKAGADFYIHSYNNRDLRSFKLAEDVVFDYESINTNSIVGYFLLRNDNTFHTVYTLSDIAYDDILLLSYHVTSGFCSGALYYIVEQYHYKKSFESISRHSDIIKAEDYTPRCFYTGNVEDQLILNQEAASTHYSCIILANKDDVFDIKGSIETGRSYWFIVDSNLTILNRSATSQGHEIIKVDYDTAAYIIVQTNDLSMSGCVKHRNNVLQVKSGEEIYDLAIKDNLGFILALFKDGHFRTKYFDSSQLGYSLNIINRYKGKKLSILGDSISTFGDPDSRNERGTYCYSYYPTETCRYSAEGIVDSYQSIKFDVENTYWMKLIRAAGMELGINESWRGSKVSGTEISAFNNQTRINHLAENGTPDVILVYGGTNDAGASVSLGTFNTENPQNYTSEQIAALPVSTFADGYRTMLIRLMKTYPLAEIVVVLPTFTSAYYTSTNLDLYVEIIKEICDFFGIKFIDARCTGINIYNKTSYLVDGIHPNAAGMQLLFEKIYKQLIFA